MTYFYQSLLKQKLLRTFVFAVLIGINSALATETKLNGGLAGLIFACFCILIIATKSGHYRFPAGNFLSSIAKDKEIKTTLSSLLITGVFTVLVFVGMNPYLYGRPLEGSDKMIELKMSEIPWQQEHFGPALNSLSKKVGFVVKRTMFPGNFVILGNILKIPIDFALFLVGLIMLLYTEAKRILRDSELSLRSIIIIWTVITFVGIIAWIPLDWPRYYLPVVPCIVMILGYCMGNLIDNCWLITKRSILVFTRRQNDFL